eukprot:Platyproteum_vivax@DN4346_c0_g1_i1.p1
MHPDFHQTDGNFGSYRNGSYNYGSYSSSSENVRNEGRGLFPTPLGPQMLSNNGQNYQQSQYAAPHLQYGQQQNFTGNYHGHQQYNGQYSNDPLGFNSNHGYSPQYGQCSQHPIEYSTSPYGYYGQYSYGYPPEYYSYYRDMRFEDARRENYRNLLEIEQGRQYGRTVPRNEMSAYYDEKEEAYIAFFGDQYAAGEKGEKSEKEKRKFGRIEREREENKEKEVSEQKERKEHKENEIGKEAKGTQEEKIERLEDR